MNMTFPYNIVFCAKDGSTMTFNLNNKTNLKNIANAFQEIMLIPKCKNITKSWSYVNRS